MGGTYNEIMIEGPFSFEKTFRRHHRTTDTLKPMVIDQDENRFIKWIHLGDKPYLLDATVEHHENGVSIVTDTKKEDKKEVQTIKEYLSRMFGEGNSLVDFYDAFRGNEKIEMLISDFQGMRVLSNPDLFEVMVDTIIGQQINLTFAATLKERFIRFAGDIKPLNGVDLYLFPRPEAVAELEYEQLRELSFSQRKSEYIIDFARNVVNGKIDTEQLWTRSNEEIIKELIPFRGIGRWTIECLMLFGLNRPDVLPAADIGLRNAVRSIYKLDLQPQTEEIRMLAEKENWTPWESYITFYMWQYLNTASKQKKS
ncbi:DNA-3-methyladenine glycosylase [Alkalihalobacillus sp. TS-13]|uniref:DNA-3-methyladenine glycosylase family protein n=1 Tax=Alkalihalobacillus sp. TS-13 TaxID=2842455 RepID=UPI001C86DAB0|nr:DNA-3-methyladenine glycosylase [Alkalihalobacillus sp. TS-13]